MKTNMKKTYTKKQIQEAINYWKKQLKLMNEEFGNFIGFFSDIDPDISDEDMGNWFDDFCKSFSAGQLDFERYMFDIAVNNLPNVSDRDELLKVCRGYLSTKDTLIKWYKRFREICDKHEIFLPPTPEHARKNGYVIYGSKPR